MYSEERIADFGLHGISRGTILEIGYEIDASFYTTKSGHVLIPHPTGSPPITCLFEFEHRPCSNYRSPSPCRHFAFKTYHQYHNHKGQDTRGTQCQIVIQDSHPSREAILRQKRLSKQIRCKPVRTFVVSSIRRKCFKTTQFFLFRVLTLVIRNQRRWLPWDFHRNQSGTTSSWIRTTAVLYRNARSKNSITLDNQNISATL